MIMADHVRPAVARCPMDSEQDDGVDFELSFRHRRDVAGRKNGLNRAACPISKQYAAAFGGIGTFSLLPNPREQIS